MQVTKYAYKKLPGNKILWEMLPSNFSYNFLTYSIILLPSNFFYAALLPGNFIYTFDLDFVNFTLLSRLALLHFHMTHSMRAHILTPQKVQKCQRFLVIAEIPTVQIWFYFFLGKVRVKTIRFCTYRKKFKRVTTESLIPYVDFTRKIPHGNLGYSKNRLRGGFDVKFD